MEEKIVFHLAGLELTGYALSIWIGCITGVLLFLTQGKGLKKTALGWTVALGIPLGLLGARLYYVLARLDLFLDIGLENFFTSADEELQIWGAASGAAFWGAVGGVVLAALIAGKLSGERTRGILDALAPSAALGIALSRFGEICIGEGVGPDVTPESLWFFPIAVVNEWEEWKYALFVLEGLTGLAIFLLLMTRGRKYRNGYRARMFLILYSSTQILYEALRRDNFLRWLFVRVSQVASAVVLLGLIIFGVLRWVQQEPADRMPKKKLILCCVLFVSMVGAVVALEFAVDKSPWVSIGAAYLMEAVCCAVIGTVSWQIIMNTGEQTQKSAQGQQRKA